MNQVGANFGKLSATQQHIASTVGQMNGQLGDLKSYLAPLVATWEGEASASYQALQAKWDSAAHDLNNVLGRISTALAAANADFQSTEKANAGRF